MDTHARSEPASCRRLTKLAQGNVSPGNCLYLSVTQSYSYGLKADMPDQSQQGVGG